MSPHLALLVLFSVAYVAAGVLVARCVRHAGDFFVAGRGLSAFQVFVTLLAANIGAGSTVGATGLAYRHGLSAWWWSGSAALGCVVLGLVLVPRIHALAAERGFWTVGDFLEWRYDRSVRALVAAVLWIGALSILAGQLIAMAWALQVVAGIPKALGCALSGAVLVAYFSGGGLLASVWVNVLQLALLLVGFVVAVPFAVDVAGGWPGLAAAAGAGRQDDYASPFGMGGPAILGLLALFVPSFIVSPGLVQKIYGARSTDAARTAVLANAAALAAFAFVPAVLGMAARAVRPNLAHAELALPVLLTDVLPPWLGALGLAALFAAEVSTADAVLFMLSTSLSQDLYRTFVAPAATDARLLRVSRFAALAAGALGTALAMVIPSVVDALKAFYGVLTATLFVPLLWGVFAARPGAAAARAGIVASVAISLFGAKALAGSTHAAWLPTVAAVAAALVVFTVAAFRKR